MLASVCRGFNLVARDDALWNELCGESRVTVSLDGGRRHVSWSAGVLERAQFVSVVIGARRGA